MKRICICFLWMAFFTTGCTSKPVIPHDYRLFLKYMPKSILVLPPANQSMEVMAPYMYLSTITRPLAEKGYYVYPVAVIDALMKENGLTSPEEMHQIPLHKINEVIHPDAVLYLTIKDWGTKYKLIDSQTSIAIYGKLVDTESGITIWQKERKIVRSSTDNADSIEKMLIAALVNQVLSNFVDPSLDVAQRINQDMYNNPQNGLLLGKYHPLYEENQKNWRQKMEDAYQKKNKMNR